VSTSVINKIIYAMGGHNGLNRIKSCEKYDSNTNQWTKFEDMNVSKSDACAAVHDRCIYIDVKSIRHDRSGLTVCVLKGLSNSIEYTFIGHTKQKARKSGSFKKSKTEEQAQISDEDSVV
jgi:hypothetical protein